MGEGMGKERVWGENRMKEGYERGDKRESEMGFK